MTDDTKDSIKAAFWTVIVALVLGVMMLVVKLAEHKAHARNLDGRYSLSDPLHNWFTGLTNQDGAYCCAEADGVELTDDDWKNEGGKYRVYYKGQWLDVPASATISKPNLYGKPMFWPRASADGKAAVLCFLPGVMM